MSQRIGRPPASDGRAQSATAMSPIVIFGAARSGTTYLTQILNAHPDVFITDETRIFVWLHECLNELPKKRRFVFREQESFTELLREALPDLVRRFYDKLNPHASFWGDKNPHYAAPENADCLRTIDECFPQTRFVHILRDGRDVVASGLRGVWQDFDAVHRMWIEHVEVGRAFGSMLPAERYFELRYEQLVQDDLAVAEPLFEFLGIDMHPSVRQFLEKQQRKRTPYGKPARDLAKGVEISDWEDVLTEELQMRSLELLGAKLVELGYETPSSLNSQIESKRDHGTQEQTPPSFRAVTKRESKG